MIQSLFKGYFSYIIFFNQLYKIRPYYKCRDRSLKIKNESRQAGKIEGAVWRRKVFKK